MLPKNFQLIACAFLLIILISQTSGWLWRRRRRCNSSPCSWRFRKCSKTCGGGIQTVKVTKQAGRCGSCNLPSPRKCNTRCCPIDCVWGKWSTWGLNNDCPVTCGGGTLYRSRVKKVSEECNGEPCVGPDKEERECNTQCCPVDCVWNEWEGFSECSVTCGGGTQDRIRTIDVEAFCEGTPCQGKYTEERQCNSQCCPVDCAWNQWGEYGECSLTCGGGVQHRNRTIHVEAFCEGKPCEGNSIEEKECNSQCCPVDCVWNQWGEYGECSVTCGGGIQYRNRTIDVEPFCEGKACQGNDTQLRTCNDVCCPVDCLWETWGEWTNCTKPCGNGTQSRNRSHAVDAYCNGRECVGAFEEDRGCNEFCCIVHCDTTSWSSWTDCSTTCGATGFSWRNRTILVMDECGGDQCPSDLFQTMPCNRVCLNGGIINNECVCTPQWKGNCCEEDVDECEVYPDSCCDYANCVNEQGSFHCLCKAGYTGDGSMCFDINECEEFAQLCPKFTECVNEEGSYHCGCEEGLQSNGTTCVDINECENDLNDCDGSNCINAFGSFKCVCTNSLVLQDRSCVVPECNCWTGYFSADTPDDGCDCESVASLKQVYQHLICAVPTAVDARRRIDQAHWTDTGQTINIDDDGFNCRSENGQVCDDYEVRLCCPSAPSYACSEGSWTPFLNEDKPAVGGGDFETLAILRHVFPEAICEIPTGIEARLEATGDVYDPTNPNIRVSPTFGFQCTSTIDSACDDYSVRFCCPRVPSSTCEERYWTDYYNIDAPAPDGCDCENLSDLVALHTEVCDHPTAMDVRLADGNPYTVAGQSVHLSLVNGFQCFTNEQNAVLDSSDVTREQCKDYMVRYCCPAEPSDDQCSSWGGEWTRDFDIDDPDLSGDYELLRSIRLFYPWICQYPYDVQSSVVGKEDKIANSSVDISTIGGLRCLNTSYDCSSGVCDVTNQDCDDYQVRFCCPEFEISDHPVDWCTTFNGLHYRTFDDRVFDFVGICPFYLAKTIEYNNVKPLHKFTIELETEKKGDSTYVIKRFIIRILTQVIEIRRTISVTVNGVYRAIPFFDPFFGYSIQVVDGILRFDTKFGVFLRYDGNHIASVGLQDRYGGFVEGLCGDYDGDPSNDYISQQNKSSCTFESLLAQEYFLDRECEATFPSTDDCVGVPSIEAQYVCSTVLEDMSCFDDCKDYLSENTFRELCISSICEASSFNFALQKFVEGLIFECKIRELKACELTFVLSEFRIEGPAGPEGEAYYNCIEPSCQTSCFKPFLSGEEDCSAVCMPGFRCGQDLVRSQEGLCIMPEECPCLREDDIPYFSEDCTTKCTCYKRFQTCMDFDCNLCVVMEDGLGACYDEILSDRAVHP